MTREQLIADLIPKLLHDEHHKPRWPGAPMVTPDYIEIAKRAARMVDEILGPDSNNPLLKLACEASEAWIRERDVAGRDFSDRDRDALDRLELATRQSPHRKVVP